MKKVSVLSIKGVLVIVLILILFEFLFFEKRMVIMGIMVFGNVVLIAVKMFLIVFLVRFSFFLNYLIVFVKKV